MSQPAIPGRAGADRLRDDPPKIVPAPGLAVALAFVCGFIAFAVCLSFTASRILPGSGRVGWRSHDRLFSLRDWNAALVNLAILASLHIVAGRYFGRGLMAGSVKG